MQDVTGHVSFHIQHHYLDFTGQTIPYEIQI